MTHKVRVLENMGTHLAMCSCGWRGTLKPFAKTAWLDGYVHRRERKVVGRDDPLKKWEDELLTYLMADELNMKVKTREWRIALAGYVKAIKPAWKQKDVRLYIRYWGKTDLPHAIDIYYDCFNLGKVVNYDDWDFALFLGTIGVRERFSALDGLIHLSKQKKLVEATTFLLHLDSRYNLKKKEWPIWLNRLRKFYTGKMTTIDTYLIDSHSKRESTWKWLKNRYPTCEAVREAMEKNNYSESYQDLMEKLENYHKKREAKR